MRPEIFAAITRFYAASRSVTIDRNGTDFLLEQSKPDAACTPTDAEPTTKPSVQPLSRSQQPVADDTHADFFYFFMQTINKMAGSSGNQL